MRTNLFAGSEKLLRQGVDSGMIRTDLDIEQTAMSMSMFCFSAFSNIHTMSKLLGRDLNAQSEMQKRAEHVADVLTKYILSKEDFMLC